MNGFRATLRRAWPVLVSYGVFSIWGVACFVASLALTSGGFGVSPGDLGVVIGLLVATVAGHIGGNLLGLARLRLVPVVVLFVALFVAASFSGLAIGPIAIFLILGLVAALGGYLGVASRLDVVAAWYPLSFAVGGAIIWMNRHGAVATFHGGSKHAVWDAFTMVCLTGAVFLMLVFLATRSSLGLTVWQEVGRPVTVAEPDARDQVAVARPGRGSILVLFVFTVVVLGATALISPYLFRTREADDGKGGSGQHGDKSGKDGQGPSADGKDGEDGQGQSGNGKTGHGQPGNGKDGKTGHGQPASGKDGHGQGQGQGQPASGKDGKGQGQGQPASGKDGKGQGQGQPASGKDGKGQGQGQPTSGKDGKGQGQGQPASGKDGHGQPASDKDGDPLGTPDADGAGQAGAEALDLGFRIFVWLLAAAIALLVFLLGVFPPIRRAFLLRHLEKPLWPVSPTSRVMNLWRRALASLAVIEIEPEPGETPSDFARRAEHALTTSLGVGAPGLREAAAIVEKIDYAGRGLGAGEEQTMREAITTFLRTVSPRIGVGKKIASGWSRAPEVEA
jgi:hypothetical protein